MVMLDRGRAGNDFPSLGRLWPPLTIFLFGVLLFFDKVLYTKPAQQTQKKRKKHLLTLCICTMGKNIHQLFIRNYIEYIYIIEYEILLDERPRPAANSVVVEMVLLEKTLYDRGKTEAEVVD